MEIKEEAVHTAVENIAPGQGEELHVIIFPSPEEEIPADLANIYKRIYSMEQINIMKK